MRALRVTLAVLLLALAGCSATRVAYNRLDWLARWEVDRYVELDARQQQAFDQAFARAWAWHRAQELPAYAAFLRGLAGQVDSPPGAAQLEAWSAETRAAWERLVRALLPDGCALLASFSEAQVQSMLEESDERIAEDAAEYVEPPEAEQRRAAERRLARTLRRWIGTPTPAQREQLARWNAGRPLANAAWIEERRRWRERFAQALARRQAPGFCAELESLFLRGRELQAPEVQARLEENRRQWHGFVLTLAPTLTEAQRTHLRRELDKLANDLEALAQPAAPPS